MRAHILSQTCNSPQSPWSLSCPLSHCLPGVACGDHSSAFPTLHGSSAPHISSAPKSPMLPTSWCSPHLGAPHIPGAPQGGLRLRTWLFFFSAPFSGGSLASAKPFYQSTGSFPPTCLPFTLASLEWKKLHPQSLIWLTLGLTRGQSLKSLYPLNEPSAAVVSPWKESIQPRPGSFSHLCEVKSRKQEEAEVLLPQFLPGHSARGAQRLGLWSHR